MKTVVSSVAFQGPDGTVAANGRLLLSLSQNAMITAGGGQVYSNIPIVIDLDANGLIPANTQLWSNDLLTPSGTTYLANLQDKYGTRLDTLGTWSIAGASPIDLSLMVPTSSAISFPNPVLLSPAGTQTIVQPTGTSLNVNRFENIRFADQFAGADLGAKINSAVADIGSGNPGTIIVPDGGGTLSTTVQLGKQHDLCFGVGTYNIKQILLADSVTDTSGVSSISGRGESQTTLFRIAGTNLDMISNTNFATLTGGASIYGAFQARVSNLKLDGNKANNATGYGIRIFGRACHLINVIDQNQPSGGIWTEGNQDSSFLTASADLEFTLQHIHSTLSGGDGFTIKGPNDMVLEDIISWGHTGWGSQYYCSARIFSENDYLNGAGGAHFIAGGIWATACQFTASVPAGWGLLIDTAAGGNNLSGVTIGNNGGIGVELNSTGNYISGLVVNSTTGIKINSASSIQNNVMVGFNGVGIAVNWALGGAQSNFIFTGQVSGAMFTGTPAQSSNVFSTTVAGGGGSPYMQFSTPGTIVTGGWTQTMPTGANSTLALLGLAQTWTTAQTFNSGIVIGTNATTQTANAAQWVHGQSSELLTLSTSGTTTDTSANLLPANSIIESVVARITTTITTATDWKLGDATQAARFTAANATMTAGTTTVGLNQADPTVASANLGPVQVSAAKVRVTTTGTPGAGVIRITVFYRQFVAPTS